MNEFELREKILKGEDLHTEFKEKIVSNEDLAKSIVCFANTDGGQLIIGIDKNGQVVGVENVDEVIRKIDDVAINRCEPPVLVVVETLKIEEKDIVVVNIPKGEQRPYKTGSGFYYIRSANKCRQARREELLRLFQATETLFFDETEVHKASLSDLDYNLMINYMNNFLQMKVEQEMLENYMKNLSVISPRNKPTFAGILFFGKNPQKFIPYAYIVCAYIGGEDLTTPPRDKKEIVGRIPQLLEDALRFIKIYIKEEHIIEELKPEARLEIPQEALREALVNSVAHRDYTISSPIRILIFKDRLEFHTPGKLPNTVTLESIRMGKHVLRNPNIYNLLLNMGLVTNIGRGVPTIIKSVKETVGRDVILKLQGEEFVLIIPRKI